jgi:exosortase A-associated hydrolase 1
MDCDGEAMLGVLNPAGQAAGAARVAVLVIVGGRQYRAGSGRHFVALARQLAAAGIPSLRFDVRGMGDSEGAVRSFEHVERDVEVALRTLERELPGLAGVVLWGLCDGASAALLYWEARRDPAVQGMVLLNPWVRSEQTLARTRLRHHYPGRFGDPGFWARLLRGQVRLRAAREWWDDWRAARTGRPARSFQAAMARAWRQFTRPMTVLLSEHDETALEFREAATTLPEWAGALQRANVRLHWVAGADHTFSTDDHRRQVTEATQALVAALQPGAGARGGVS